VPFVLRLGFARSSKNVETSDEIDGSAIQGLRSSTPLPLSLTIAVTFSLVVAGKHDFRGAGEVFNLA
jgi:hypothetical protein